MKISGKYKLEVVRGGKSVFAIEGHNAVTNGGLDKMLDVMFHGVAAIGTWYIGLIDTGPSFSAADTMGSHAGWAEFTSYDEAARVAFTEAAASGGIITASAASTFTISATGTIGGIFVTSDNTKGGTTGTLWSTMALSTEQAVLDNDVINITYTITATPG